MFINLNQNVKTLSSKNKNKSSFQNRKKIKKLTHAQLFI